MLSRVVQGAVGTILRVAWVQDDGVTPQNLDNVQDLTGTIQPLSGPLGVRGIEGTLTVIDGPGGIFHWALAQEDVETPDVYLVRFTALLDDNVTAISFVAYWLVEPSGGLHPFSLPALRARLMELTPGQGGVPTPIQYHEAITQAVTHVSSRLPRRKAVTLNIVAGTESYELPPDFLYDIDLETVMAGGGVGYSASGKLIAHSDSFVEVYNIDGMTLTLVPPPAYNAERRLWYAARYITGENEVYQGMTQTVCDIVLLKAQELILRLQAREAENGSAGLVYQLGDLRIDKRSKGANYAKLAVEKESEFERAITNYLGPVGALA